MAEISEKRKRIEEMKKKALKLMHKLAIAGIMSSPLSVSGGCIGPQRMENDKDGFNKEQTVEQTNLIETRQKMEKKGAFFLDYERYMASGDVTSSVVYLTYEQMSKKGVQNLQTSPFDISLARENSFVLSADSVKNKNGKAAAFSNISGSYNGGFQLSSSGLEVAVLWGLIQEDSPEIREFCKGFIKKNVDITTDKRFLNYRNEWNNRMKDVAAGKTKMGDEIQALFYQGNKKRAAAVGCINANKPTFNKLSKANPEISEKWQKEFCSKVYLMASSYYEKNKKMDLLSSSAAFAAIIHSPNSASTSKILASNQSSMDKAKQLIALHGNKGVMKTALENIFNNGYISLSYCTEYARYFSPDAQGMLNSLENGVNNLCRNYSQETVNITDTIIAKAKDLGR